MSGIGEGKMSRFAVRSGVGVENKRVKINNFVAD